MASEESNNSKWLQQMINGKTKIGCNLNLSNPYAAGFDFVMVDTQHSQVDSEKLIPLLQAIKLGGAKSFIRLESPDDRSGIQHAFDCGVDGILCPFIRTADDVKKIVEVSKYPGRLRKEGTRSLYVNLRPTFYAGSGPGGMLATYNKMNAKTIVAIQIETAESIDNIAEILSVPGVDIAFIGPGDLASSMGIMCKDPFKFSTDSELNRATDTVLEACLLHKVIPGCWAIDPKSSSDKGFKFMCVGSDMEFLRTAASQRIEGLKQEVSGWEPKAIPVDPSDV